MWQDWGKEAYSVKTGQSGRRPWGQLTIQFKVVGGGGVWRGLFESRRVCSQAMKRSQPQSSPYHFKYTPSRLQFYLLAAKPEKVKLGSLRGQFFQVCSYNTVNMKGELKPSTKIQNSIRSQLNYINSIK